MPNALAFLPNAIGQSQPPVLYGQVAYGQPAPTSFLQPLYVHLTDWTTDFFLTFENWPVIHGATLPAVGADVTIMVDNRENYRVVWWDGAWTAETQANPQVVDTVTTAESVAVLLATLRLVQVTATDSAKTTKPVVRTLIQGTPETVTASDSAASAETVIVGPPH
jgi:hypothetical protein